MHGRSKGIGIAIITISILLLTQGVVFAAPVTDTSTTAGQTDTTASTTAATVVGVDIFATAGSTTAGTTATAVTTGTTAAPAPQREPEVPFRPLIQKDTPWDQAAQWYEGDTTYNSEHAVWRKGRAGGKSLYFNGSENYMLVDVADLKAPFTLSVWVNRLEQTVDAANQEQRIFTLTGKDGHEIYLCPSARRFEENGDMAVNGLLLSVAGHTMYYPATKTVGNGLPTESWHHVALSVEEKNLSLYVDGVRWAEADLPVSFTKFEPTTLRLGGSLGDHKAFHGYLEDCRLYDGVLTPLQVTRLAKDKDPFDPSEKVTALVYNPTKPETELVTNRIFRSRTEDGELKLAATQSAFWEAPRLIAGQSVTGILTLQNHARYPARMTLSGVELPAKGTDEYAYLSQLTVTVSLKGEVLYSGPYTELSAETLKIDQSGMAYGAQQSYEITVFCPFYCAVKPAGTVKWNFDVEMSEELAPPPAEKRPIILMILLAVSATAVVVCVIWSIKRRVS